jgi:hypothetical protein
MRPFNDKFTQSGALKKRMDYRMNVVVSPNTEMMTYQLPVSPMTFRQKYKCHQNSKSPNMRASVVLAFLGVQGGAA